VGQCPVRTSIRGRGRCGCVTGARNSSSRPARGSAAVGSRIIAAQGSLAHYSFCLVAAAGARRSSGAVNLRLSPIPFTVISLASTSFDTREFGSVGRGGGSGAVASRGSGAMHLRRPALFASFFPAPDVTAPLDPHKKSVCCGLGLACARLQRRLCSCAVNLRLSPIPFTVISLASTSFVCLWPTSVNRIADDTCQSWKSKSARGCERFVPFVLARLRASLLAFVRFLSRQADPRLEAMTKSQSTKQEVRSTMLGSQAGCVPK